MLLFIGGMSFVIYKVSGQQSFFDTFDALTSPGNKASGDVIEEVEILLNKFLNI